MVDTEPSVQVLKVADVVGYANTFSPYLGSIFRFSGSEAGESTYQIKFDVEAISLFAEKRTSGMYKNDCFAKEVLAEAPLELTRQSKKAAEKRKANPVAPVGL
ncbi:hypothetical protein SAMN04487926_11929 [Paraburkholderia steynii]|uniref:Uncharacterized protein n=1 Tax=Paraburkholderia steynii TaxID=1245441 RepID=A0A7Z7FJD6_9BURK|nr:hypothetical protein [Paraburkholderia steynii]SDI55479.1 hypothetical protein SAMN04487926_11929 [Paraburkholderia steynii]